MPPGGSRARPHTRRRRCWHVATCTSKAADVYSYGVLLLELTYSTLVPLMRLPKGPPPVAAAAAAAAPDLAPGPGRPP